MTRVLRDFGNALVVALLSIGLMVGALSISLVEFVPEAAPTATSILIPSPAPLTPTATLPPTSTPVPGLETPTAQATATFTNVAVQGSCQYPAGWGQVLVQPADTLDSLASRYRVNRDDLKRGNCLVSDTLVAGKVLYVPSVPTSTVVSCSQGASGWVKNYVVKSGDTLFAIASSYSISANLMKTVNCRNSDLIFAGEILWVPNVPTRTPFPTPLPGVTATPIPTEPLTETALPFTGTPTPSETPVPPSPTASPTSTPVPTPTSSPTSFP